MRAISPPPPPRDALYTPFWCEENIHNLARALAAQDAVARTWDLSAVFISNPTKTVALWMQRLAAPGDPVVWDYHVVLLLRPRTDARARKWVYDLDTRLPTPCAAEEYIAHTFRLVAPQYQSCFRVVPVSVFLDNFASDRSHMLVKSDETAEERQYESPPPPYPPLCGAAAHACGVSNNLMERFVSMVPSPEGFGNVLDFGQMVDWIV